MTKRKNAFEQALANSKTYTVEDGEHGIMKMVREDGTVAAQVQAYLDPSEAMSALLVETAIVDEWLGGRNDD